MTNYLELVKEFHQAFGCHISEELGFPEQDIINLRNDLISEETYEFEQEIPYDEYNNGNIVKAAKELADILYVVFGTALTFGIPIDDVFEEVHKSNMSKLDQSGKPVLRADGKVLKSKYYQEPNLYPILYPRNFNEI